MYKCLRCLKFLQCCEQNTFKQNDTTNRKERTNPTKRNVWDPAWCLEAVECFAPLNKIGPCVGPTFKKIWAFDPTRVFFLKALNKGYQMLSGRSSIAFNRGGCPAGVEAGVWYCSSVARVVFTWI